MSNPFGGLKNLFSGSTSHYTPDIDALIAFSKKIYSTANECATTMIQGDHAIADDRWLGMTLAIMHGYLILVDRQVFSAFPAKKRSSIMDYLVAGSAAAMVDQISGQGITRPERKKAAELLIDKYNNAARSLGACKKMVPDGDEPAKGTFLWELGKGVAAEAGHSMDVAYIYKAQALFTDYLSSLDIARKIQTL